MPRKAAILVIDYKDYKLPRVGEEATKKGFTVTTVLPYPPGTTDFSSFVSKANVVANMIFFCGPRNPAFESYAKDHGLVRQP
jgi:hypothetical protein